MRFSFSFRYWVAGWGKNSEGELQRLMRKVDLPIYQRARCGSRLKEEMAECDPRTARALKLHPSEICAGTGVSHPLKMFQFPASFVPGGEAGKDACSGDGGSPMVCQSREGRWHLVGLVNWGVCDKCAEEDVPGVYVNVYHFKEWIDSVGVNNVGSVVSVRRNG